MVGLARLDGHGAQARVSYFDNERAAPKFFLMEISMWGAQIQLLSVPQLNPGMQNSILEPPPKHT